MKYTHKILASLLVAGAIPLSSGALAAADILSVDSSRAIPDQYIVVLKDEARLHSISTSQFVTTETNRIAANAGVSVMHQYDNAILGFSIKASPDQVQRLAEDSSIAYIEQDQVMYTSATQSPATWGLDRIDQRQRTLDNAYTYDSTGRGVHAYIIDTGILGSHQEFAGRMGNGFAGVNDGRGTEDCNGHGTHVAGTVGGSTWGVAKDVTLHSVRVFGCSGETSSSIIIDAVNWVASNHVKPAVANMSLGGGISTALDSAVRGAVNRGVTVVVAAGNDNANACSYSPARESSAVTVASSTSSDSRSNFSNWGSCVDLFAPGSDITSAWWTGASATNTISGTSMASPHGAGMAALLLEEDPGASPSTIERRMIDLATTGAISGVNGSPNRLLYTEPGNGGGSSSSSGGSSSSSSGGSSGGGSCSAPQYVAGASYSTGQEVQNLGSEYRCDVAGWCSSSAAWAYEPGAGLHWETSWTHLRSCDDSGSSSSGGSSSGGSGSSSGGSSSSSGGSSSGGGTCPSIPTWNAGAVYLKGDQVQKDGVRYEAKWWTQGDDPSSNNGGAGSGQPWMSLGACN
ncbi:S8 family serine peptidase [Microbulbifer sp. Q7]|uniref:S8 family serine peptidase n=1 Tax=Microbulbifer sp. Q7 TaxID=1785091 RepID=UPI000AB7F25E|nr:S8 family serine peptidase [Microbulbifer sp. Q7]